MILRHRAKPHRMQYRRLAQAQGVERPFETLARMSPDGRRRIAAALGCRVPAGASPEAEAWRIINQNLRGLQARTHSIVEQLTPFSRNNNWWEIVTRTARRCGVRFYPGQRDIEIERLLFERLADLFVQHLPPNERFALDSLVRSSPDLDQALHTLRLSRNGMRTVLSAIVLATARADESLRDGAALVRDWIRDSLRWSWRVSIAGGLRLLHLRLDEVFDTWVAKGFWDRIGGNDSRVCAAVAAIYLQDLVDRTLDEAETAGV